MSFVQNNANQLVINDRYNNLTVREKKMIEESWASPFAEFIFPAIREDRFGVLYSGNSATRPNTPVNIIVGSMIIKELQSLTDDEVLTGLMFDIRMQYALHTTSFKEQPLSDRTFSRFRLRLYEYEQETGIDLMKEEILALSSEIAKLMKLKPHMKRTDSLMIASACKDMTRLEVVYVTVSNLVNAVQRVGGDELLDGMEQYLNSDDKNRVIYHNRAEDRAAKIQSIIEDGAILLERLGESGAELPEYTLVVRLLEDQSIIDEAGNRVAKDNRAIAPNSLQNPSDPEATYRKKAGEHHTGYVANVVETFDENGNSVITDYEFEQNRHSDSEFCKSAIKNIAKTGEATPDKKVVLIGDGAFASAENSALAEENNIILVTTALAGPKPPEVFADFEIDKENKKVTQCPAGHAPIKQGRNPVTENYRIVMEKSHCEGCPHRAECKAKMQKKSAVVNVSENKVERARVANTSSVAAEEYAEYRNARNAIEGIPSLFRRIYNVDEMPVFGIMKSKLLFGLKVAAINVKKLAKFVDKQSAGFALMSYPRDACAQM
jgi:hypothetical protein